LAACLLLQELSFLPVDVEIDWQEGLVSVRVTEFAKRHGLPAWKRDELNVRLQAEFERKLDAGDAVQEALDKIDSLLKEEN